MEEHFYIGLSILCVLIVRNAKKSTGSDPSPDTNPFKNIPLYFLGFAVICLGFRIPDLFKEYDFMSFLAPTHKRVDSLFFGVLLSYLWHYKDLEQRLKDTPSALMLTGGILLLAPPFFVSRETHPWISVFGPILFYVGSGLILMTVVRLKATKNKLLLLISALGAASYSIYLWHMAVEIYFWPLLNSKLNLSDSFAAYFLVYIFGSLAFGWVMNRAVEWPVLLVRDKLFLPRNSPPHRSARHTSAAGCVSPPGQKKPQPMCG